MPDYELTQTAMGVWSLLLANLALWIAITIAMLAFAHFGRARMELIFRRFLALFYSLISIILMVGHYLNLVGIVYFRERVVGLRAVENIPQVSPIAVGISEVALIWLLLIVGSIGTAYFILNGGSHDGVDNPEASED